MTVATEVKTAVENLRTGDLVNLQNDQYADPKGMEIAYQYSYGAVEDVTTSFAKDGSGVITVSFIHDGWDEVLSFPQGHEVLVEAS